MEEGRKEKIGAVLDKIIGLFLIVLIFTIPFPSHIQTTETFCFLIIILAFIAKSVLHHPIKGTKIDLPIFIFTVFIVISIFFSVDYLYSLHEFRKYWLRPVLLLYIIVNFAVDKRNISYVVLAVVISSLVPITFGLIQYFTEEGIRLKSLFGAPTEFGQYLDYIIPLMFAMVLWNKTKTFRILLGLILIGAFFCLIFTYTRASFVSIFIAIMFLCFMKNKKLVLILIVLSSIFIIFSPHSVKNRITNINNKEIYCERIYLLKTSMNAIKKRPLTGFGWGYKNFYHLYPSFVSPKIKTDHPTWVGTYHVHNYPVEIAFETGILASIVFLWLWITIMVRTWKNFTKLKEPFLKSIAGGIFAAFIACSIHWLVEIPDAKQLIMTLWVFIGVAMTIVNLTKENGKRKSSNQCNYSHI